MLAPKKTKTRYVQLERLAPNHSLSSVWLLRRASACRIEASNTLQKLRAASSSLLTRTAHRLLGLKPQRRHVNLIIKEN
jgi:hypothetical protein